MHWILRYFKTPKITRHCLQLNQRGVIFNTSDYLSSVITYIIHFLSCCTFLPLLHWMRLSLKHFITISAPWRMFDILFLELIMSQQLFLLYILCHRKEDSRQLFVSVYCSFNIVCHFEFTTSSNGNMNDN